MLDFRYLMPDMGYGLNHGRFDPDLLKGWRRFNREFEMRDVIPEGSSSGILLKRIPRCRQCRGEVTSPLPVRTYFAVKKLYEKEKKEKHTSKIRE
jgi:hypothetical protein